MTALQDAIQALGGLAAMHELLRRGHSQRSIRTAVGRGELIRVRKGWYCPPTLALSYQAAARVGGRLTCVSLAEQIGLWIPPGAHGLHVAVRDDATQLRSSNDYHERLNASPNSRIVVHWNDDGNAGSRFATDLGSALLRISRCLDLESAFVLFESALFHRALRADQARSLLGATFRPGRERLAGAGALSESGTESMFRFRAGEFGVRIQQQARLGVDRVDFLLGERLVIEIDSVAHHDPTEDAKRDARLSVLGYRVLRFMYSQVVSDWSRVRAAVMAAISRGDHLPG